MTQAAVKRTVRVVAALIHRPGDGSRFLVQQRLPGGSRGLLWEFPGGKVEPGESEPEALARECREELDVRLHVGRRLWAGRHEYSDLTVELALYVARLESGEPKTLGAHALAWLTPAEMLALPFCEADIPPLEDLVAGRWGPLG
ncbi:MAG TPA: (deoxy)nucleoside triphosphate pyrophosphohydrolase [Archangium sp.]|uniref:(deoxy)nucleoside triphosphate pyrophosphohydrolase n=1 Tax=Archangium sp. TaxID=1872627 RepID=UPI002E31FA6D|nr:(deoxy)nucleoside triphosphate pyrophosphohydrolase [Archangium sp.]HEX5744814.1 (deoxy)nucleoside triphosphate pyrophosphohydrolase [Archangium sp.]